MDKAFKILMILGTAVLGVSALSFMWALTFEVLNPGFFGSFNLLAWVVCPFMAGLALLFAAVIIDMIDNWN